MKNNTVFYILNIVIVVILTIVFAPEYINGDQFYYINAYNEIKNIDNIFVAYTRYHSLLNSYELIHFLLIYFFANILQLDKVYFDITTNIFLIIFIIYALNKLNISKFITFIFVNTNFYIYILLFSAERLKISMIFLLISIFITRYKNIFIIFAILAHIQSLLLYISIAFKKFVLKLNSFFKRLKIRKNSLFLFILIVIVTLFLKDQLLNKAIGYLTNHSITIFDIVKTFIFMLISLFYNFNKKLEIILLFIPLIVASLLIGDFRVNIFAYMITLYYIMPIKRGGNLLNIILILFFSLKGIYFLMNVLEFGNGFEKGL